MSAGRGQFYITRTKFGGLELRIHYDAPPSEEDHFVAPLPLDAEKAKAQAREMAMAVVPFHENGWPSRPPAPPSEGAGGREGAGGSVDPLTAPREPQGGAKGAPPFRGGAKVDRPFGEVPKAPTEEAKFRGAKDGIPQNEWKDDPVVSWGKHKGKKMSEVPKSYLHWMLTEWESDGPAWQRPFLAWAKAHIND